VPFTDTFWTAGAASLVEAAGAAEAAGAGVLCAKAVDAIKIDAPTVMIRAALLDVISFLLFGLFDEGVRARKKPGRRAAGRSASKKSVLDDELPLINGSCVRFFLAV
jgi:hypothetical protein